MKKIAVMERRNRFFLGILAVAVVAVLIILIVPVNRAMTFSGGYRLSFSYIPEHEPYAEGEQEEDITTLFDGMVLKATEKPIIPLNIVTVYQAVSPILGSSVHIIDDGPYYEKADAKESGGHESEAYITFEVASSAYPGNSLQAEVEKALGSAVPNVSFTFFAASPVEPIFNRTFLLHMLAAIVAIVVLVGLWLAFRLSRLGGFGIMLLLTVSAFFTAIVVMAGFILARIPLGFGFICVEMSMLVLSLSLGVIAFLRLQDEGPKLTKTNYVQVIDQTISQLVEKEKWLVVLPLVILIVGAGIAHGSAWGYTASRYLIPIALGWLAAFFSVLFFAIPFWGSSLDEETLPEEIPIEEPHPSKRRRKKKPGFSKTLPSKQTVSSPISSGDSKKGGANQEAASSEVLEKQAEVPLADAASVKPRPAGTGANRNKKKKRKKKR